uniref:Lipase_GDSL domain-containing protein n=1 Tax=Panagrellus redivivus TaxID=6233 RepID=A0A7E4VAK4_PANRE
MAVSQFAMARINTSFTSFSTVLYIYLLLNLISPLPAEITSASTSTLNKTANSFHSQSVLVQETPATITDSEEDHSHEVHVDDHVEDDDLNRGALSHGQEIKQAGPWPLPDPKNKVDEDRGRPDDSVSFIDKAFTSRRSFSCPKTKQDFVTGHDVGTLNPEDIGVIAAMGDNIVTGQGLWAKTEIEFRGAAFPIGGDASIDGLVTIPNILREFISNGHLIGVSHGMGSRNDLPPYQLNVAVPNANSGDLPEQATELVRRLEKMNDFGVKSKWTMVVVVIGTQELCYKCGQPNLEAMNEATDILNRGIHKAFVVVVGPLYVSLASQQSHNMLRSMCPCTRTISDKHVLQLYQLWENAINEVQNHANTVRRQTFGVLALPALTITSRYPSSLFAGNTTLLNRRGHNYAAKWLWNRLIAGPKYNLSDAILSRDKYFCPSVGCPYFRTTENYKYCTILRHVDATVEKIEEVKLGKKVKRTQRTLYMTAAVIVGVAFCTATIGCTVFYLMSKHQTHGRFDMMPVAEDGEYNKPRSYTTATTKEVTDRDSEQPLINNLSGSVLNVAALISDNE